MSKTHFSIHPVLVNHKYSAPLVLYFDLYFEVYINVVCISQILKGSDNNPEFVYIELEVAFCVYSTWLIITIVL